MSNIPKVGASILDQISAAIAGASPNIGSASSPAPNPAASDGNTWGYTDNTLPLFGASGKPQMTDVTQGSPGDCYVLSDLQLLANQSPDFLKDHIKEIANPDDPAHPNYEVSLFNAKGQPQTVTVDSKQMLDATGQPAGAGESIGDQTNGTALWPAIYEKAFTLANGKDMNSLSEGDPSQAWQTLTGTAGVNSLSLSSPTDFAKQVKNTSSATDFGTVDDVTDIPGWTGSSATINDRYQVTMSEINGDTLHVVDTKSPNQEAWELPLKHAMGVTGVTSADSAHPDPTTVTDPDKLRVQLRNPWGPNVNNRQNLLDVPFSVISAVGHFTSDMPLPASSNVAATTNDAWS